MKRCVLGACWLLALALVLPSFAADEKKADAKKDDAKKEDVKKDAKKGDAKKTPGKKDGAKKDKEDPDIMDPAEKEKPLAKGKSFTGKLTRIDGNSQRDFTVQLSFTYAEPDYQAQANLAKQEVEWQQRYRQILMNANAAQRQQQLAQLTYDMAQGRKAKLFNSKTVTQDVELRGAEDMVVRLSQPPLDYDEKGKVRKYTAKELKEMKGTAGLPGYQGELSNLQVGQIVQVYPGKNQKVVLPTDKKGGKDGAKLPPGGKKGQKDELDNLGMERPEVVMILVLHEPPMNK